jgi:hypothetical protein
MTDPNMAMIANYARNDGKNDNFPKPQSVDPPHPPPTLSENQRSSVIQLWLLIAHRRLATLMTNRTISSTATTISSTHHGKWMLWT